MELLRGLPFLTLVFGGPPALVAWALVIGGTFGAGLSWRGAGAPRVSPWAVLLAAPQVVAFALGGAFDEGIRRSGAVAPAWFTASLDADVVAAGALALWFPATGPAQRRLFLLMSGAVFGGLTWLLRETALMMTLDAL